MSSRFLPETDGVRAALRGYARTAAPWVRLNEDPPYLAARHPSPARRVGVLSGGGSGHEPLHGGFVGRGMLDAAVPGQVFASPHNRQVYEASRAVAREEGVLHIVKNYTGDRINFGIAAERLAGDGIRCGRVLVDDDLATERDDTSTGRRGTGGAVIVEKLVGAAADQGRGLDELVALGTAIAGSTRSIAAASHALTALGGHEPAFDLGPDELEYGVGIHGERAPATIARPSFDELVARMAGEVLGAVDPGDEGVLLFVNGLGATSNLELYAVFDRVAALLDDRRIAVAGSLVGGYVAALDMSGFSLTATAVRDDWQELWAAPSDVPAFPQPREDAATAAPGGSR